MSFKTDYIHEKGTGIINEDALSLNGNLFGVFDGATSLDRKTFENNNTGGYYASAIASKVFSKNNDSLRKLAEKANTAIFNKMLEQGVPVSDKHALWSTSAAVVKIENNSAHWIQTGDSLLMLIYRDGTYKIPITNYGHDSETLLMWKQMAGKTDKKIFEALEAQIRKVRSEMNVTYGVLNGENTYSDFINTGSESLENVSHILLFTDGLFIPCKNPETNDWLDDFARLFLAGGLSAIRNHVRSLEESDPDCRIYPRFKPHDDIAAVALTF